jgi:hypothetical protein
MAGRAGRSWTVVVVPSGSDAPRTLEITERAIKRGAWALGGLAVACTIALTVAAIRLSGMPMFEALMTPADRQLSDLRTRMAELRGEHGRPLKAARARSYTPHRPTITDTAA